MQWVKTITQVIDANCQKKCLLTSISLNIDSVVYIVYAYGDASIDIDILNRIQWNNIYTIIETAEINW